MGVLVCCWLSRILKGIYFVFFLDFRGGFKGNCIISKITSFAKRKKGLEFVYRGAPLILKKLVNSRVGPPPAFFLNFWVAFFPFSLC